MGEKEEEKTEGTSAHRPYGGRGRRNCQSDSGETEKLLLERAWGRERTTPYGRGPEI